MSKLDRLSALMSRFDLAVSLCRAELANFQIIGDRDTGVPTRLVLTARGGKIPLSDTAEDILLGAQVEWGGAQNPMIAALPDTMTYAVQAGDDMGAVVDLLLTEHRMNRCGSSSVLSRLVEVLIVRLMRVQIEAEQVETGLLGGLADPRLSRAIVAIHDRPERPWRLDDLAEEAGLSTSHFSELFRLSVGETPLAYLRNWRLTLARQDIERGDRVKGVALRYCYGSTEALSRAFSQAYGASPTQLRKAASSATGSRTP